MKYKILQLFLLIIPGLMKLVAQPNINSIMPDSGPVNTIVMIKGVNFSSTPNENIVLFNGAMAEVIIATDSQLVVQCPMNATTGEVSVQVSGLISTANPIFNVWNNSLRILPTVNKFSPTFLKGISSDFDNDGNPDIALIADADITPQLITILTNEMGMFRQPVSSRLTDVTGEIDLPAGRLVAFTQYDVDSNGISDVFAGIIKRDSILDIYIFKPDSSNILKAMKIDGGMPNRISMNTSKIIIEMGYLNSDDSLDIAICLIGNVMPGAGIISRFIIGFNVEKETSPAINTFLLDFPVNDMKIKKHIGNVKYEDITIATRNGLRILENDGAGNFVQASDVLDPSNSYINVATGDINGDGYDDICGLTEDSGDVNLFLRGSGGDVYVWKIKKLGSGFASGRRQHIRCVDFNNDGLLDIAIDEPGMYYPIGVNEPGVNLALSIFENQSTGPDDTLSNFTTIFINKIDDETIDKPKTSIFADLNNDGFIDIILAGYAMTSINLPLIDKLTPEYGSAGSEITVKGINLNRVTDVKLENRSLNFEIQSDTIIKTKLRKEEGGRHTPFQNKMSFHTSYFGKAQTNVTVLPNLIVPVAMDKGLRIIVDTPELVDVDNDNDYDLVFIVDKDLTTPPQFLCFLNDGNGKFNETKITSFIQHRNIKLFDIADSDDDGRLDLLGITVNEEGLENIQFVEFDSLDRAFLKNVDKKRALDGFINATTKAMKIGNFLGENEKSLLVITERNTSDSSELSIYKKVVKFKAGAELAGRVNFKGRVNNVHTFNSKGFFDIFYDIAIATDNGIIAFRVDSSRFSMFKLDEANAYSYIAIGDLDGDGVGDIIGIDKNTQELFVFYGNVEFEQGYKTKRDLQSGLPTGKRMYPLIIDFDKDGRSDIIISESNFSETEPPKLNLLYNKLVSGTMILEFKSVMIDPDARCPLNSASKFVIGDVDNDGYPDILSICPEPSSTFPFIYNITPKRVANGQTITLSGKDLPGVSGEYSLIKNSEKCLPCVQDLTVFSANEVNFVVNSTSSKAGIQIHNNNISVRTMEVLDIFPGTYIKKYLTAKMEDWAKTFDNKGKRKPIKRKFDKVHFDFNIPVTSSSSNLLTLEFSMDVVGIVRNENEDTLVVFSGKKITVPKQTQGATFGERVNVKGIGNKGKIIKVKYAWDNSRKTIVPDQFYELNKPGLPMPNLNNVGEEIFSKPVLSAISGSTGGAASAGYAATGLMIGTGQNNSVFIKKFDDVLKSLYNEKNKNMHMFFGENDCKCLDTLDNGKPINKQLSNLPPERQNNPLFAEVLTLKLNIGASLAGRFPSGLGDLIYLSDDDSVFSGMSINEISLLADSALSCLKTSKQKHKQWLASNFRLRLYQVIKQINNSFSDSSVSMDTLSFSSATVFKGVKSLIDVPFMFESSNTAQNNSVVNIVTYSEPADFSLGQNYPNPFNTSTTISFSLPYFSYVTIKIYNLLGQEIATLLNKDNFEPGTHFIEFDGNYLSSGVYFYQIHAESVEEVEPLSNYIGVRKMLLLK